MAAEKNRHEKNPHDTGFFDDLNERVFKDYEPPKRPGPIDESDDDEKTGQEGRQAA